jgi:ribosomal protein L5
VLEISVVSKLLALTEEEINLGVMSNYLSEIDIDKVNKISGMDISL